MKNPIKIGITGQTGFLGINLYNHLSTLSSNYELINFQKDYFQNPDLLDNWVLKCDTIIHFAALSRHNDSNIVYLNNIGLVNNLLDSIKRTNSKPNIIFSSSKQEELDTSYGKSKKEGRNIFSKYSNDNGLNFTGLIIPNVFGPLAKPKYASVVATFCYQLINDEIPIIISDSEIKLIYIDELVIEIEACIKNKTNNKELLIKPTFITNVSNILELLKYFKEEYIIKKRTPLFSNKYEENMFTTFRSYI
jgi:UDP-2-acetamido-2,6-beta-L-arabino-hexul-4-ose reductase